MAKKAIDDSRKKLIAVGIFVRNVVEGKTLTEAWREVMPDSTANDMTARKQAAWYLKWYREHYPHDMQKALEARGLGYDRVSKAIDDLMGAETPDRQGVMRPDWRAREAGTKLLMIAMGEFGKKSRPDDDKTTLAGKVETMNVIFSPRNFDSPEEWELAVAKHNRQVEEQAAKDRTERARGLEEQGLKTTVTQLADLE